MHKEKEGQRGEFSLCLPLAVRLLIDQERHEVMKDVVDPLRVGSRAQKIPLLSTGIFSKCGAPDSPYAYEDWKPDRASLAVRFRRQFPFSDWRKRAE